MLHVVCTGADSLPAPLFALIVAVQDAAEWRQATDEQRAELMRTRAEATSLARQLQAAEEKAAAAAHAAAADAAAHTVQRDELMGHSEAVGAQNGELRQRLEAASEELRSFAAATEGARAAAEEQILLLERRLQEEGHALENASAQLASATATTHAQQQELERAAAARDALALELQEMRAETNRVWVEQQRQARQLGDAHRMQVSS